MDPPKFIFLRQRSSNTKAKTTILTEQLLLKGSLEGFLSFDAFLCERTGGLVVVLAHGSNDDTYRYSRTQLDELMLTGVGLRVVPDLGKKLASEGFEHLFLFWH